MGTPLWAAPATSTALITGRDGDVPETKGKLVGEAGTSSRSVGPLETTVIALEVTPVNPVAANESVTVPGPTILRSVNVAAPVVALDETGVVPCRLPALTVAVTGVLVATALPN